MKKQYMLFMLLLVATVCSGCSSVQQEFWEKNQAVQEWEATTVDMDMNYHLDIQGESVVVNAQAEGVVNTETQDAHLTLSMKDESGIFALNDIEIYTKEGQVYISKNYFETLALVSGMELPEDLFEEDVAFISLTQSDDMMAMLEGMTQNPGFYEQIIAFYETFATEVGIDIPVEKVEEAYRVQLDEQQIIALIEKIVVGGSDSLEMINTTFNLGLTAEEIGQVQESILQNQAEFEQGLAMIGQMISGNFIFDTIFGEDTVVQTMEMNISESELTGITFGMSINAQSTKADVQEITVPGKVQVFSIEEFEQAMMGNFVFVDYSTQTIETMQTGVTEVLPCKSFLKDGEIYVESRVLLGALGEEVVYNAESKQVGIQGVDFKPINVEIKENVSYIGGSELVNLGYIVEVYEDFMYVEGLK